MDSVISKYKAVRDDDLMMCPENGVAYQKDMQHRVQYDESYLAKCVAYEGSEIATKVNDGRCALLKKHLLPGASVLDIGVGSGAFMRAAQALGFGVCGYDVIPEVVSVLRYQNRYSDNPMIFNAVTMWDSMEHMEQPAYFLKRMPFYSYVFISLPVFDSLDEIRASKHYRPGEHLYYWTTKGLIDWISQYGFSLRESSPHECQAGRERIGSFVFMLDRTRDYLFIRS